MEALYALNWAEKNPLCVAGVYVDAPSVISKLAGRQGRAKGSRMTGNKCLRAYDFNEQQALSHKGNPVDNMRGMAKAGIPFVVYFPDGR